MTFKLSPLIRPKPKVIYVLQYGGFWKLLYREWIDICLASQKKDWDGYLLPSNRQLTRRPRIITKTIEDEDVHYNAAWPHILVEPLDWESDAYKDWLLYNDPDQLESKK